MTINHLSTVKNICMYLKKVSVHYAPCTYSMCVCVSTQFLTNSSPQWVLRVCATLTFCCYRYASFSLTAIHFLVSYSLTSMPVFFCQVCHLQYHAGAAERNERLVAVCWWKHSCILSIKRKLQRRLNLDRDHISNQPRAPPHKTMRHCVGAHVELRTLPEESNRSGTGMKGRGWQRTPVNYRRDEMDVWSEGRNKGAVVKLPREREGTLLQGRRSRLSPRDSLHFINILVTSPRYVVTINWLDTIYSWFIDTTGSSIFSRLMFTSRDKQPRCWMPFSSPEWAVSDVDSDSAGEPADTVTIF